MQPANLKMFSENLQYIASKKNIVVFSHIYRYYTFLKQTILNNCSLYPRLRDFTELILLDSVCVLFCFQTILLFVLFSNYSFFVFKQFFFLFCFQIILFFPFFSNYSFYFVFKLFFCLAQAWLCPQ